MKSARLLFITGTDTGVGKTVFAALATRSLREKGFHVAALKPICSGGRDDARQLHRAAGRVLSLAEVNPWHFRAPLAPLLAARQEKKRLRLRSVVAHIRRLARRFDVVIVEGAGGLLSPLGENFDSRDLIQALNATAIVVCPNRLGAVNQVRLVLAALPPAAARQARVVLVNPPKPDAPSKTNVPLLAEFLDPGQLCLMPWIRGQ
jgi:dethiobiotin synthetase